MNINKELPGIKKELIKLQKRLDCSTVSIKKHGIEFIYFTQMANGRKNIFKAGMMEKGIFVTKEI